MDTGAYSRFTVTGKYGARVIVDCRECGEYDEFQAPAEAGTLMKWFDQHECKRSEQPTLEEVTQ